MSRPRKPFGANHPGRLPATMMKVLAAEMSDPARLRRGKQYAHDGSVLDLVIEPGVVTGEIQGSRSLPYVASVFVTPGDGMPLRRDVTTQCSCPDDDNWEGYACKHVVATMFALSDEFLLEPELLDVWRGRTGARRGDPADRDDQDDDGVDGVDGIDSSDGSAPGRSDPRPRHLRLVREAPPHPPDRHPDRLAALLTTPVGATLPDLPPMEPVDAELPRTRELAAVLRDALANLRIRWE
jgi:hypothetical protein